jgi:hypothetical protein
MALFEPASQNPNFDIFYQQYLARQKNTEDLLTVVGDNSSLEGEFTSLEDVVTALVGQLPVHGDPVATTSGTSVSLITTIPSWAKRVTVTIVSVSTNGTSPPILQIGPSGGVETSGYSGGTAKLTDAAAVAAENHTNGFRISADHAATRVIHGIAVLELHEASTNTWVFSLSNGRSEAAGIHAGGGSIALSGALTQITATTVGGVNAYDGGSMRVRYEA